MPVDCGLSVQGSSISISERKRCSGLLMARASRTWLLLTASIQQRLAGWEALSSKARPREATLSAAITKYRAAGAASEVHHHRGAREWTPIAPDAQRRFRPRCSQPASSPFTEGDPVIGADQRLSRRQQVGLTTIIAFLSTSFSPPETLTVGKPVILPRSPWLPRCGFPQNVGVFLRREFYDVTAFRFGHGAD
jgi:hypothetical protein